MTKEFTRRLWTASTRFLYDAGFIFFALFYLPLFFAKGKHKAGLPSRLGRVPESLRRELAGKKIAWFHAVSVGEAVQAIRLMKALHARFPGVTAVLTVTTVAGHEVARKMKDASDILLPSPLDFRPCMQNFVEGVSPAAVMVMETEIWPNLIFELSARRIPVFILNGRISDAAFRKYRAFKFFFAPLLERLDGFGVQDERMKERFVELGAPRDRVFVTGNVKFDWEPDRRHAAAAEKIAGFVKTPGTFLCVAGSTHEGEEAALFKIYLSIRSAHPGFRMLIAPRHLDRLPAIESAAAALGVGLEKVSECAQNLSGNEAVPVFILDEMGILASLYQAADAVFVGGSLVPVGGHNLVEPAFFEKPIVFGPFMGNFKDMAEAFKEAGAALEVDGAKGLEKTLLALFQDESKRRALGAAAKKLVERHRGAAERNLDLFLTGPFTS